MSILTSSSLRIIIAACVASTLLHNSVLGMLVVWVGAILDCLNRRETFMIPSLLNSCRYTTAPIASLLASENACIYLLVTVPIPLGWWQRGSNTSSSLASMSLHWLQQCFIFSGSGSSQPRGSLPLTFLPMMTICCSISFLSTMTGDTNPRGSYTEFITDRTPLCVKCFSGSETWKVKWSQWTSRERCDGSKSWCRCRSLMFLAQSSAGFHDEDRVGDYFV